MRGAAASLLAGAFAETLLRGGRGEPESAISGCTAATRNAGESGMPTPGVNLTAREAPADRGRPNRRDGPPGCRPVDRVAHPGASHATSVGLYRRRGGGSRQGAREVAAEANERGWAKAEVFEEALARVSRQLAAAAQRNARDLAQERLAQARKETPVAASGRTPATTTTRGQAAQLPQDTRTGEVRGVDEGGRRPVAGQARQPLSQRGISRRLSNGMHFANHGSLFASLR